jgi:HAD superfamily hydrolase (TIGR01509 family)
VRATPELVIFDCDGVLVDSEPLAIRIDQMMLRRVGMTLSDQEVIDRFVGRSQAVVHDAIAQHLGHPIPDDLTQEFEQIYYDACDTELRPVDGVGQALAEISQATCVASSSEPAGLRHKLRVTGLLERFGGRLFTSSQVQRGKPAPDLFLFAAEQMGFAPGCCAVVEDSRPGVEAGVAAGMAVFGYAGSVTPAASLRRAGAIVFDDMRALPALLAG